MAHLRGFSEVISRIIVGLVSVFLGLVVAIFSNHLFSSWYEMTGWGFTMVWFVSALGFLWVFRKYEEDIDG